MEAIIVHIIMATVMVMGTITIMVTAMVMVMSTSMTRREASHTAMAITTIMDMVMDTNTSITMKRNRLPSYKVSNPSNLPKFLQTQTL
jgi:heme/copper-type cytochrome/quinol oxidase subunit 2